MFWKYNMEMFKVLEIIPRKSKYNFRLEYKVTNGKYIKYIDRETFLKGETFIWESLEEI